ncbi:hypothetical protein CARUB_v10006032mg [Capsella rubella]|uniref:Uncharacterized protein n=1 Tax=Capsella rubella TaxID=81985 RepID=R0H2D9_9BRAS|nr:uncharacterized protein LOC17879763 [Capsella rubella]EOA17663.1 hypothetical protein CARUB_v10006032mg [Capsella rubella]
MEKEECSSSESGWTTYISSPIEVDEEEVVDQDYQEVYNMYSYFSKGETEEERNKDSDDSMASDASSGPNYHQRYHQKNKALELKNGKIEGNNTKSKNDIDKKTSNSYKKKEKKKRETKSTYRK